MTIFASHALTKTHSKEYIRNTQVRLIIAPMAERLLASVGKEEIEKKLKRMLSMLRDVHQQKSSYAAGNILNLLIQLKYDLRGYDFSNLIVRQAYLQGVSLPKVNFAYSNLMKPVFTETFGNILSVA